MRGRLIFAGSLLASVFAASAQRRKAPPARGAKPPDLRVVKLSIQRDGGNITIDGKVRNNSGRPVQGVVLFFEFLEPGGQMISRMTAEVSDAEVAAGEDGEFLTQTPDQARAVRVRVDAEDKSGRYLTLDKPGPYVIE